MVCCGLQWLFDSKQSRKRQHRQQRQPRKKKKGKRQTQGDRVTGWQGEAARQSTVEYSCDVSGATLACRLQEATSHQQGMPMPHLHTTCIALQDTQLASCFQQKKSSACCTLINGNASIFAGRTRSSGRGGSRRALMQHVSWTGHDGTLCGSICVSLNSCLFSHGEEARIKREEDEKRGKDVMSVSMPQALASTCT